ncbi:MAG: adenylate/guanylate cyclase domain-containing protein [Reyranella sp.]|uniref:adenylate/guanylate cyclase domain-containing protein n=1 Tax=Reyranella sp. TaxID=1929291 RepID=UPI0027316EA1|nr:adenylate/guanylate cyclase domain-containing protein [Reyranella sp.]MDP1966574.1 adenylate/guanylate cyclase domain-containing protein [Reyranella sp.]MDP2378706.1 adenylate/guanylate cyclase domain-containing protein [Reyranella sp.]
MPNIGTNRRLATILFADIDGYSRLMRADEEQTLVDLHAHLSEVVGPVIERFHGRIVKTVGDGVLVEFGSAVEAIRSAVELQRGMFERNVGTPVDRRQAFRIGLHLGDVIVVDEDVFGDTVNVAARLQNLAEPDSIVLSDSVYEQVRDKLALPFRDLGRRTVKNIDRPIRMYALDAAVLANTDPAAIAAPGPFIGKRRAAIVTGVAVALIAMGVAVAYWPAGTPSSTGRPPAVSNLSVAVLVLTNQSGDSAQDYFSDGLTEDITRALGRFKQLTVLAYGAVLPFRGKEVPLSEIGRALNARYLVAGSVRRMGSRVRVTIQLSDAANGTQLWAQQYDDEMSDIFAVQERIARRVAGTLASNLQQIALQQSLRKPTDNLDAYDLLLRSRAFAAESTRAGNRSARELLDRATLISPTYAEAYAETADAHFQRATHGWAEFPDQDIDAAIRFAQKAIELDEECVLAHSVLARAYTALQKYDLGLAESERALQINPSDAEALLARAAALLWTARIEGSIAAAEFAIHLNPNIGPEAALNLGIAHLLDRRYADAVKLLEAARTRYPAYPLLDFPLAGAYAELGRNADAMAALEQGRRKNPHFDLASFGSRFQDPALQSRIEASLRKAGLN